ncbi:TetR family transcriptional regulator [Streptomyces sp. SID9727]|uniref:TetR family transcriptional regulator C-terminal domain-containing protein n=1 Tax=Streptomyces sp. SID9727 TaxID=2706114 RepID=UPI0013CBDC26|nr:TetR/AcrR family transcriptional regulator [Streptomyces sp. SID9727]
MPLTPKGAATKQRIVEGAAAAIRRQGVFALTLDDVLALTSTSKSQLFHYFPGGKDELMLSVARHEADRVIGDQQPELGALTSWPAWLSWRDKVVARYREQGRECPLDIAVSRIGPASSGAQAVASELLERWQNALASGIRHMQSTGEIDADRDADRSAAALLAGIQGGVVILLSTGSPEHLEAALDQGIADLRRRTGTVDEMP